MSREYHLDPNAKVRDVVIGPNATHGSRSTYARGCRCDACRAAWADDRREKEKVRRRQRKIEEAQRLLREEGLLPPS
jgi:hypothetical protein